MNDFTGRRIAVVTGASGGIGNTIVEELVAAGFAVVGIDLRNGPVRRPDVEDFAVDVTDESAMDRVFDDIGQMGGSVEALVTTAAILRSEPIHEMSPASWREVIDINLTGVFLTCRLAIRQMLERGGAILNLSSVHAEATIPGTGAYAASKGAIVSLTRQIAVEYADRGIRANSLVVGSVATEMTQLHARLIQKAGIQVMPPAGVIGQPVDPSRIAAVARFLVSPESAFITGSAIRADGGLLSRLM